MSKQDGLWADDFAERLLHPNEVIFCIFKLLFFNSTKPEVGIEKSGGVWTDVFVQSDLSVRCDHSDSRQRETCGRINKFALLLLSVSMIWRADDAGLHPQRQCREAPQQSICPLYTGTADAHARKQDPIR